MKYTTDGATGDEHDTGHHERVVVVPRPVVHETCEPQQTRTPSLRFVVDVSYNLLHKERCAIRKSPKTTTQSLKTEPRIIKETGSFFAKYTCVKMASRKIQAYQNKARNLCTIYFLFDFDGKCKFIKTKHYSD